MKLPLTTLKREDFNEVPGTWLDKLLRPLNTQFRALAQILNNGILLSENVQGFSREMTVQVPAAVTTSTTTTSSTDYAVQVKYSTSTASTIASNTDVRINYVTKVIDTHNAVTTGSSWVFTAPIAGTYAIAAAASVAMPDGKDFELYMDAWKNGAKIPARGARIAGTTPSDSSHYDEVIGTSLFTITQMAVSDTLYVSVHQQSDDDRALHNLSNGNHVEIWRLPASTDTYGSTTTTTTTTPAASCSFRNDLPGHRTPVTVLLASALDITSGTPVAASASNPAWSVSADQIVVREIAGLTAGHKYKLIFWVM